MTWSYNLTQLGTNQTYQVRFLIGDTLTSDQQIQDEEVQLALSLRSGIYGAAAECCRNLAARYAREADVVQQELRTAYSTKSKSYSAQAQIFEGKSAMGGAGLPAFGAMTIADKQSQEQDPTRVPPQFQLGMDDNYIPVSPAGPQPMGYPSVGSE